MKSKNSEKISRQFKFYTQKSLYSEIKSVYMLFDTVLYCHNKPAIHYDQVSYGVIPFLEYYGFWPVINFNLHMDYKGKEALYINYSNLIEILPEYRRFAADAPENYRRIGIDNPFYYRPMSWTMSHLSAFYKSHNEYVDEIVLKILYKKNLDKILRIYKLIKKLKQNCDDLYYTYRLLRNMNKTRGAFMKGKKIKKEFNTEGVPPIKKQTTSYIRKIVIEEIDFLRSGKVSVKRSRVVSSLAARVLESMHLDLEAQYLFLKNDLDKLELLPEYLNGKRQD